MGQGFSRTQGNSRGVAHTRCPARSTKPPEVLGIRPGSVVPAYRVLRQVFVWQVEVVLELVFHAARVKLCMVATSGVGFRRRTNLRCAAVQIPNRGHRARGLSPPVPLRHCREGGLGFPFHVGVGLPPTPFEEFDDARAGPVQVVPGVAVRAVREAG